MAILEHKRPPFLPPDWKAERAELCRRVSLLDLLAQDGRPARKSGDHYVVSLRAGDKTPSCHVWPPGSGSQGAKGWTFKDFGGDQGGDALGYLLDVRGMEFEPALFYLAGMANYWPEWLVEARRTAEGTAGAEKEAPGCPRNASKAQAHALAPPEPAPVPAPPKMPVEAQARACAALAAALLEVHPQAEAEGDAYLAGRGVLPARWQKGSALKMPAAAAGHVKAKLAARPDVEDLVAAGILKPAEDGKPIRLQWGSWAGDVVLLAHQDPEGRTLAYIARRLDFKTGDVLGKYLMQTYERGAVRLPFGLPTLYRPPWLRWKPARDKAAEVLVVEGTADAMGAACLGWPALALSMRPQARGWKDRDGAAARMLSPHLPALRSLRLVRVMPDNDAGEKGAEGQALAARLVAWLRAEGCRAEVSTLSDLYPDEAKTCKDLGDVSAAASRKDNKP